MIKISKDIYKKDKKKMNILDFGCGSMEISKKLEKLSYVKKIIGVDTFSGKFKTKKKCDILNTMIFLKKIKKNFDLIIAVDVLHHIGVDRSHKTLKNYQNIPII